MLDGVPYAVIDGIDALPYPTTAGTSYVRAYISRQGSPCPKSAVCAIYGSVPTEVQTCMHTPRCLTQCIVQSGAAYDS